MPPGRYSSTRYEDKDKQEYFSFEEVVLKGLASDGGLFLPESGFQQACQWQAWSDLSFADLAYEIMRLYINESEISNADLRTLVRRSYSTFRHKDISPVVTLSKSQDLYLLELFHGPTFAFKDVALQFLGNLFEFFLARKNARLSPGQTRHHLTVIGATSGDTGSAAIYGLRGKKDVSIFIMFPNGKVSPVQEAQMTTVLDPNVHNLALDGTFDDCQDTVKALFADVEMNKTHHLAAVNSINWARILAQITYYFYAYFQLLKQHPNFDEQKEKVRFVVPTGNFGDILAGWFAKQMGLPIDKLVIATNENDILHRFWQTGKYEKQYTPPAQAEGGIAEDGAKAHSDGVQETLSPAMDILVSSNFERLLWYLQFDQEAAAYSPSTDGRIGTCKRKTGAQIALWFQELRSTGAFAVSPELLSDAEKDFSTYRISDQETTATIKAVYDGAAAEKQGYVLDPHSAIGVAAALQDIKSDKAGSGKVHRIALATAHPAKFANAVDLALKDTKDFDFEKSVLPREFDGLDKKARRVIEVGQGKGLADVMKIIITEVEKEKELRNGV